jgi:antitoxin component YwqK of YwqJK toxin-antitoxin module
MAMHNPEAVKSDQLEKIEKEVSDDLFREETEGLTFKIILPESFLETDTMFREYYDDGTQLKFEGKIHNGALNENWRSYYESGNIKNSVNYTDGELNGEAYFYYDDAKNTVKAEAIFEDDKITGTYYEFYENGAQKAEINYVKGLADKTAKFFYANGKLKIDANYKDGLKHGRWIYYDERGNEVGREKWKKGERVKDM